MVGRCIGIHFVPGIRNRAWEAWLGFLRRYSAADDLLAEMNQQDPPQSQKKPNKRSYRQEYG